MEGLKTQKEMRRDEGTERGGWDCTDWDVFVGPPQAIAALSPDSQTLV